MADEKQAGYTNDDREYYGDVEDDARRALEPSGDTLAREQPRAIRPSPRYVMVPVVDEKTPPLEWVKPSETTQLPLF